MLIAATVALLAQPPIAAGDLGGLVDALLARSAPPADWRPHAPFGEETPPPDDASLEVLAAWWSRDLRETLPTRTVQQRLLEAVVANPRDLLTIGPSLPATEQSREVVERLVREYANRLPSYWSEFAAHWLENVASDDEIFDEAARAHDTELCGVQGEGAMRELLALDRARALPVLEQLARSEHTRVAILARCLLYEDALRTDEREAAELRPALLAIVADRSAPPLARYWCLTTVMKSRWPGRDAWLLDLLRDPELRAPRDGSVFVHPLEDAVAADPDVLIPQVAQQVGAADRSLHDHAVACLAQFCLEDAREAALRPLLPWLADASWATDHGQPSDRLCLIRSLGHVSLREAIPGLIHVLRHEAGDARKAALYALTHYADAHPGSALREIDPGEQVTAVEAYARFVSRHRHCEFWHSLRAHERLDPSLDPGVVLGAVLVDGALLDEPATERLCARADLLASDEPDTARILRRMLLRTPYTAVATRIVAAIRDGSIEIQRLALALERRSEVRQHAGDALARLATAGDEAGGIATAFLDDRGLHEALLRGDDRRAQAALLACARLVRVPLPIADVGALLDAGDGRVALAAEAYLFAEDGPAARALLFARHAGQMVVLGARDWAFATLPDEADLFDPGSHLVEEMRGPDPPDEIFALLSDEYWSELRHLIVRVRGDHAELEQRPDDGPSRRRPLGADEWAAFREAIEAWRFFELPPLLPEYCSGIRYHALHLTSRGGCCVFMHYPGADGSAASPYDLFVRRFERLAFP